MPARTAYGQTLIIELMVLENLTRKQQKSSYCVFMQAYICAFWLSLGLRTSPHILHYKRFKRILVNSNYFIKIFRCVIRWNECEK